VRPSAGPHNRVHVRTCVLCVRLCPSRPTVYSSTESRSVSVCNVRSRCPRSREKNRGFTAATPKWALSSPHAQGRSLFIANPNHIPLPSRDILACNGKKAMARATATIFTPDRMAEAISHPIRFSRAVSRGGRWLARGTMALDNRPLVTHLLKGHRILGDVVVLPST